MEKLKKLITEHCNGLELLENTSLACGADDFAEIYESERHRLQTILSECDGESSDERSGLHLADVDCQFLDSYGTPVKHGTKIIIETNYNYQHFNNREALVEWHSEKGMYRFMFTDDHKFKSRHDFWGIHRFKVVQ
jgi:hypothetical protein